jgi:hypothetical protein
MSVAVRISEAELERRMLAVDNAVAQQRLEGLTVSEETVEDLRRSARGEVSIDQVIESIHARLNHVAILRS